MDIFGRLGESGRPGIGFKTPVIKICLAAEALPTRHWDQGLDAGGIGGARDTYTLVPVHFDVAGCGGYRAAMRDVNAEHAELKRVTPAQAICCVHCA